MENTGRNAQSGVIRNADLRLATTKQSLEFVCQEACE
jgi:hypothetical protein